MAISWTKKPTDLERLEQSKVAKSATNPLGTPKYESDTYITYAPAEIWGTGGSSVTYGSGVAYTPKYIATSTVPPPVRPPMTIPISFFPESLIHKLMQESFKDGASAEEILLGFAHGLMAHIEVTYDGDFRLRIKE